MLTVTVKVKEMKGQSGALTRAIGSHPPFSDPLFSFLLRPPTNSLYINKDSANQSPPQTSSTSGKKYIISLVLDTEHLHDLEFAIRSSYSNDFRMVNTLQFYSDKASLRGPLFFFFLFSSWIFEQELYEISHHFRAEKAGGN